MTTTRDQQYSALAKLADAINEATRACADADKRGNIVPLSVNDNGETFTIHVPGDSFACTFVEGVEMFSTMLKLVATVARASENAAFAAGVKWVPIPTYMPLTSQG